MREYNDLKQKCEQLEQMVEILQMSPCTVDAPLLERYAFIFSLANQYSVNLLCKTMKVAKGSYYNHILRNKTKIRLQPKEELRSLRLLKKFLMKATKYMVREKSMLYWKSEDIKLAPTLWLTLCTITAGSLPEAEQRNSTLNRKSVNNLQQHINWTQPNPTKYGLVM